MLDQRIEDTVQDLENPLLRDFRSKGGRALGFFCSYVPQELLNVDGLAAFRMRSLGCTGTEMADSSMGIFNCGYTRHCLEKGLEDGYAFLDGFVFVPGCDHLRRLCDNWAFYLNPRFLARIDVPHLRDADAREWYRQEIRHLWERISEAFSLPVDENGVWKGIQKTNRTRRLLQALDRTRLAVPARLTGREMLELSLFAASTPPDMCNPILEETLETVKARKASTSSHRARVLLVGSHLDDPRFVGLLEETGALVVRDAYCCGLRDQLSQVNETDVTDPFEALAGRYLDRLSCPRMYDDYPRRLDTILSMAEEARVDGIILEHLKFCETWGIDGNVLLQDLRCHGYPVLKLEREYLLTGTGQIRTRVQAFLESMGK